MRSLDWLNYYRQISQQTLAVVDLETTGRFANSDRVTEISVVVASLNEGIAHQQTALINPQTWIPGKIQRFTGITQAMVDDAPIAADVLPNYLDLLQTGILTAHNIAFDYPFLQAEYMRLGIDYDRPAETRLCTVQLARLMLPELPSRSLPNLVEYFNFNVGRSHRAAADALACWLLAEQLLNRLLNEPEDQALDRFARQWIPLKEAAQILNCSLAAAQLQLEATQIPSRTVGRWKRQTLMYRRGDVEQLAQPNSPASPEEPDV